MIATNPWGIDESYWDGRGVNHPLAPEIRKALNEAMDASESSAPPEPPLRIIRHSTPTGIGQRCLLTLEDGTSFEVEHQTPADLPLGYHRLRALDGSSEAKLIVTPDRCYLPENFKIWGWALQLYALRSAQSWGIGDLEDLRRFSTWSADKLGARLVMTNPLGAAAPVVPQQPSPYFPSSRIFRNLLYLSIPKVPGAFRAVPDLSTFHDEAQAVNDALLIDRDAIYELKMRALDSIWPHVRDEIDLSDFEREQGPMLDKFAAFCVLAELHGANWRQWPSEFRDSDSPSLQRVHREHGNRLRFFKWVQWLIDQQLAAASERRTLMQDLPIGVDPDGADAWIWQDLLAKGVSVGAPPDPFSAEGQDWGLPPFVPHKLRAAGYEPFSRIIRAHMRYSAGLRIDHVMGLFRLFWIPVGHSREQGTYVRYNPDEMLSILALESVRAQSYIVGEDLGTVEDGVREKLADYNVLSYKVLWFEPRPPREYPNLAMAASTTHDLPTIAGVWTGADFAEQQRVGTNPSEEGERQNRERLKNIAAVPEGSPVIDVILAAHRKLAESPSAILCASLDDVLGAEQRPNLPGTMNDRRPNWSIPLPKRLEGIEADEMILKVGEALRR